VCENLVTVMRCAKEICLHTVLGIADEGLALVAFPRNLHPTLFLDLHWLRRRRRLGVAGKVLLSLNQRVQPYPLISRAARRVAGRPFQPATRMEAFL
jgi:hypothetical protein